MPVAQLACGVAGQADLFDVLEERVQQRVAAAVAAVLAGVLRQRVARRGIHVVARQEIRHADRKADDVAAFGLEPLGLFGDQHDRAGLGATHAPGELGHRGNLVGVGRGKGREGSENVNTATGPDRAPHGLSQERLRSATAARSSWRCCWPCSRAACRPRSAPRKTRPASRWRSAAAWCWWSRTSSCTHCGAGGVQEPRKAWTETARRLYPQAARELLQARRHRAAAGFRPARGYRPGQPPAAAATAQPGGLDEHPQLRRPAQRVAQQARQVRLEPRSGRGGTARRQRARTTRCSPMSATAIPAAGARRCGSIGFLLLGGDIGGGVQVGLASLVDLRTGQVVWHNLLLDQTGDLRDPPARAKPRATCSKGIRTQGTAQLSVLRWPLALALALAGCATQAPLRDNTPGTTPGRGHRRGRALVRDGARRARTATSPQLVRDKALNDYVRKVACEVGRRLLQGPARLRDGRAAVQRQHGAQRHDARLDRRLAADARRGRTGVRARPRSRPLPRPAFAAAMATHQGHQRVPRALSSMLAYGAGIPDAAMLGDTRRLCRDLQVQPRHGTRGRPPRLRRGGRPRLRPASRRRPVGSACCARRNTRRYERRSTGVRHPSRDPGTHQRRRAAASRAAESAARTRIATTTAPPRAPSCEHWLEAELAQRRYAGCAAGHRRTARRLRRTRIAACSRSTSAKRTVAAMPPAIAPRPLSLYARPVTMPALPPRPGANTASPCARPAARPRPRIALQRYLQRRAAGRGSRLRATRTRQAGRHRDEPSAMRWMLCALLVLAGCASSGGRLVQPGPNPAGGRPDHRQRNGMDARLEPIASSCGRSTANCSTPCTWCPWCASASTSSSAAARPSAARTGRSTSAACAPMNCAT